MAVTNCPNCKAPLPDSGGFEPWCPACDWNLDAESSFIEWKTTALDNLINRVRGRYAQQQFEALAATSPDALKARRLSLGKAAAYLIAAFVNCLPLVLLAAGIWIIVSNWLSLAGAVWGGLLMFAAWVFRPRRNPMPKDLLDRSKAPHLYAFVDRVAEVSGAPKVHALILDADINASFQKAGLLGRPIVTIGLPLWSVLEPQERVALLSHEFAHGINGDSLAHGFVGNAINTLLVLAAILEPDTSDFFTALISPILALLSGAFRWLGILMIVLLWQRSQEAEFLADHGASRISGTDAAQSLLSKAKPTAYVRPVLEPIAYALDGRNQNFFPAFREFVANLPPLEVERARRLARRVDFATSTTHPPDWARQQFLKAHPSPPTLHADPVEMTEIDAELEKFEQKLTGKLIAAYYPNH